MTVPVGRSVAVVPDSRGVATVGASLKYLLVVELDVEVIGEGQGVCPDEPAEGETDGAVVQQEVKQVLIRVDGTHHPICPSMKRGSRGRRGGGEGDEKERQRRDTEMSL